MKQLFFFLNVQFVLKYLLNPGGKHFVSACNFVETSIHHKSARLHDGKMLMFSCGKVPLNQFFVATASIDGSHFVIAWVSEYVTPQQEA